MLYPIGIQNFAKLREEGYVYVDKTDLIYRLATSGTYYFLSRPRRFGKSLLISTMEALFANTTYQIQGDAEKNFRYAMYIIMELLGEYVQAERSTSNGRIDLLLQTKDYIYIVELKIDNTAEVALQQIEDKGYAKPFVNDSRKLFKIGVSFSTANRRIEEWKIAELNE